MEIETGVTNFTSTIQNLQKKMVPRHERRLSSDRGSSKNRLKSRNKLHTKTPQSQGSETVGYHEISFSNDKSLVVNSKLALDNANTTANFFLSGNNIC
jgi:hypothetical protein